MIRINNIQRTILKKKNDLNYQTLQQTTNNKQQTTNKNESSCF